MRLLQKCVMAFVVLVTLALCIGPMVFLAGLVLVPAIHVQRTIHDLPVYPGADRLFTERSQYSIGGVKTVKDL